MKNLKKRLLKNPISSIIGVLLLIYGLLLPFLDVKIEVTWLIVGVIELAAVLLLLSKDKLVEIILNKIKKK